jgi:DNA polymerase III subunit delta'
VTSTQHPAPSTLIVGHQKRWAALSRAFGKGQVPQTLLISGPPQCGKETLARRYAQLLLCPNTAPDASGLPAPCGTCRVCHQVNIETFPDYVGFRPLVSSAKDEKDWVIAPDVLEGSILTVEVARKFGDEALRRPLAGQRKVMLIVQAERMNIEAQNALLKTFEEPSRGLTIVLLADNPSQLLPTVRSRCWHLPLGLAPDSEIAAWLSGQFQTTPETLRETLRVAGGRPGAAWREMRRLLAQDEDEAAPLPRFSEAEQLVERIMQSQPVGALGLTEEALRLARVWWAQDQEAARAARGKAESKPGKVESKKLDGKELRSAMARFLDELANVYRARWKASLEEGRSGGAAPEVWAGGLDQVRRTRHYILRNANTNLALDVLFGRLIAAQSPAVSQSKSPGAPMPGNRVGSAQRAAPRASRWNA